MLCAIWKIQYSKIEITTKFKIREKNLSLRTFNSIFAKTVTFFIFHQQLKEIADRM